MTIKITQICDSCDDQRELRLAHHSGLATIKKAAEKDGWRSVQTDKHLCNHCICGIVGPPNPYPRIDQTEMKEDSTHGDR